MIIPFPMNMESRKVPWFQTTNQMINSGDLSKKMGQSPSEPAATWQRKQV
jgi:hypothetical protein